MTATILSNVSIPNRFSNGFLDRVFREVMPAFFAATWIDRPMSRGKNVLPSPIFSRIRIFPRQRVRQIDFSKTGVKIVLMQKPDFLQMMLQLLHESLR